MPLTFLNVLSSNDIYLQQRPFCRSNILLYRIHLHTSFIIVMLAMACMNSTTSTIGVLSEEQNAHIRACFIFYVVGKGSRCTKERCSDLRGNLYLDWVYLYNVQFERPEIHQDSCMITSLGVCM